MVQAIKGVLVSCDIPMAQFVIHMNDQLPAAQQFIIYVLDDTNIFVQPNVVDMIQKRLQEFRDQNTYEKPLQA
ncbi:general transcription and DNA repair factor IIH subunit TFB5-like [Selaginella moellendorffii]|uniref:general transcription and DNA repair factor IIH subunit TFB5-like n=1 Tax=Selaginella moellendorffii TaxID=88036 RepID=UPI000D1CC929|nr:general transcription and DNA repair factor IIH subunit TFB5-like [Selaginella moellendorffii]|eukprot:XP_024525933.1 general transcription and DNA repair factor IIH subunit TFB5-like [Selaginella moellendorffii]